MLSHRRQFNCLAERNRTKSATMFVVCFEINYLLFTQVFVAFSLLVAKKRGKIVTFLRLFLSSRPSKARLLQSGILKWVNSKYNGTKNCVFFNGARKKTQSAFKKKLVVTQRKRPYLNNRHWQCAKFGQLKYRFIITSSGPSFTLVSFVSIGKHLDKSPERPRQDSPPFMHEQSEFVPSLPEKSLIIKCVIFIWTFLLQRTDFWMRFGRAFGEK